MTDIEIMLAGRPPWEAVADGDYGIVELFGHTTLVGRIAEVERFGTKMLAIEPLFAGQLLGVVFHGGSAIYRLTPCSRRVAWERQPKQDYQLPPAIRAVVPTELLASPVTEAERRDENDGDSEFED